MVRIDKKIAKASRQLADSYETELMYTPGTNIIYVSEIMKQTDRFLSVSVPAEDIPLAIDRLEKSGFLRIRLKTGFSGPVFFSIEPKLRHRHAFLMDSFSKRFVSGFVTGFATGIASLLLLRLIPSLCALIMQLLSRP